MEKEQQNQNGNSPETEPAAGVISLLLDVTFRKEVMEMKARHDSVVEIMDGCLQLVSLCNTWIAEQEDFETSELKQAMVMAFYEKIQSHQSKLIAEFKEIEPKIIALSTKFQGASAAKEVDHGNSAAHS